MKASKEVTRKALALANYYSWRWFADEIIDVVKISRAVKLIQTDGWDIDQATAINSRYEQIESRL